MRIVNISENAVEHIKRYKIDLEETMGRLENSGTLVVFQPLYAKFQKQDGIDVITIDCTRQYSIRHGNSIGVPKPPEPPKNRIMCASCHKDLTISKPCALCRAFS